MSWRTITDRCDECALVHNQEQRLTRLRRALPITVADLRERHPCTWPATAAGEKRLYRDLHSLGAVPDAGCGAEWSLPERAKEAA